MAGSTCDWSGRRRAGGRVLSRHIACFTNGPTPVTSGWRTGWRGSNVWLRRSGSRLSVYALAWLATLAWSRVGPVFDVRSILGKRLPRVWNGIPSRRRGTVWPACSPGRWNRSIAAGRRSGHQRWDRRPSALSATAALLEPAWTIAALLGLLFVGHVGVFGWRSVTFDRRVTGDSMNYIDVARNLSAGEGLVQSAAGYNQPTFWVRDFTPQFPEKTRAGHNPGVLGADCGSRRGNWTGARRRGICHRPRGLRRRSGVRLPVRLAPPGTCRWATGGGVRRPPDPLGVSAHVDRARGDRLAARPTGAPCARHYAPTGRCRGGWWRGSRYSYGAVSCRYWRWVDSPACSATAPGCAACCCSSAGASIAAVGPFLGEGQVYPPQTTVAAGWFPDISLSELSAEFLERAGWTLAAPAFLGACAWWRAVRDGQPIVPDRARYGCVLAIAWITGWSAFLMAARLVVLTDMFDDRMLAPLVAVTAIASALLVWCLCPERLRLPVAVAVFAATMTLATAGDAIVQADTGTAQRLYASSARVVVGRNMTARNLPADGDRSDYARRIARSPRRLWVSRNVTARDLVVGAGTMDLPFLFRQQVSATVSFSYQPYFPEISGAKFNAVFLARCRPLRQPVPDPQQASPEVGPIRARSLGRSPRGTGHTGRELREGGGPARRCRFPLHGV